MPPIPIDFVLFALTLTGVALFHHHTLKVAVSGLTVITVYKVLFAPFRDGAGLAGLGTHLVHEWVVIANLGLLLTGFALLARQFEESGVPEALPRVLPSGWGGGFALLGLVFVLSSFLDNIAAALAMAGVAIGIGMTAAFTSGGALLPADAHATGFGLMMTASLIGLAASPIVAGFISGPELAVVFEADVALLVVLAASVWVWMGRGRAAAPPDRRPA